MSQTHQNPPVAIIGLSLRLPKSNTLGQFWQHLISGESLIEEVPAERWDSQGYLGDPRTEDNKTNSIWGGFVDDIACFDADFFEIPEQEATYMDPQQRIGLEMAWGALEDAGYPPSQLAGSNTGVFMSTFNADYAELVECNVAKMSPFIPTGTCDSMLSNRLSYFFDFTGPSFTVNSACTGSSIALHQAVRAIEYGECDQALAGGFNFCWSPKRFIAYSMRGMLSKDGRCKSFDDRADGYVRGEGGGIVMLKSQDKAERDGDHIYALIRGIGTNHGGRTNAIGITNPKAHTALITNIYRRAGVSPESVSYIEAHGPGTPMGDAIEVHGLKNAFDELSVEQGMRPEPNSCGLGSVKTNIGHLEGASGFAGMMKVIAALKHKTLPATVNFKALNPLIKLEGSPFYVVDQNQPWSNEHLDGESPPPLRAGVSSYGFGGSNAHILLEEYQGANDDEASAAAPSIIPLSAKQPELLLDAARNLTAYLEADADNLSLADVAHTLQVGREAMEARIAFTADSIEDLTTQLKSYIESGQPPDPQGPAKAWVSGKPLNWALLQSGKAKRISLPTYPFARTRYWIPVKPS